MYASYEKLEKAVSIILKSKEFVKVAHDNAELKHDNYGKYYMDGAQHEIMEETESLLKEMDDFLAQQKEG